MDAQTSSIGASTLHHPRLTLLPSDDQLEMRDAVRGFLANAIPNLTADAAAWDVVDPTGALWRRMAHELGLQGLTVPEELGGQGFGITEAAILFEELGRALCSAPLLGSLALAGRTLQYAGGEGHKLLAAVGAGEIRATGALDSAATVSVLDSNETTLSGQVLPLIDGTRADVIVVAAQHPDGVGAYLVEASAPGVELTPLTAVDLTRGFASLALDGAPARLLIAPGEAEPVLERVRHESVILLAAESVGAARRSLDAAVEYARTRVQFGQPIGSFQALKHRMADILVSVEGAWSTVRYAAALADLIDQRDNLSTNDLALAASVARVASDNALAFAAAECIQIHGGIGFTWEYSAHLAYRRSVSNRQLLGSPDKHRDDLVARQASRGV